MQSNILYYSTNKSWRDDITDEIQTNIKKKTAKSMIDLPFLE